MMGMRKIRRYTPSYDAIVKNIRGVKPESASVMALGVRPITKGFKWMRRRRIKGFKGRI